MLIQLLLFFFIIFALSRVLLQVKQGNLTFNAFFFWTAVFSMAIIGILYPQLTSKAAEIMGIGRGADAVIYVSIALLFYLVFRISVMIEDIRHEISELVRKLAFKEKVKEGRK